MSHSDNADNLADLAYDNSHRAFLQAFISLSTLTFNSAKPLLARIQSAHLGREILSEDITQADFDSYVDSVNRAISPYDLEIRNAVPQTAISSDAQTNGDGANVPQRSRVYALVNTTSDAITQLATTHTAGEIGFVKRVLDDMFDKNNTATREVMAVNSMQALSLARGSGNRTSGVTGNLVDSQVQANGANGANAGGITKSEAEKMLRSMVDEGWFLKHRDYYTLSPRALIELRGWLLETYNEPEDESGEGGVERVKLCHGCREIVTIGQRCRTRDCRVRFHDACTRTLGREPKCPACREVWTGTDFVGLRALRGRDGERER